MGMSNVIEKACAKVGGQASLARVCGVKPPSVSEWIAKDRVPEERCPAIEKETNAEITCEELRPDVNWVRVRDRKWPHRSGRPLVDHTGKGD